MQAIWILMKKEVAAFFNSLIAYIVIAVFLIATGLFFWIFEGNVLETGFADLDILFTIGPWFFLFLVPAITMRSFAEEIKMGTLELLYTKPVQSWQILLGKYLGVSVLVLLSLVPTLLYYASVYYLGDPPGNLDQGATIGSYLGLAGIGIVFAAIGLFASTLTDNQLVAFLIGAFLCFFWFVGLDYLARIPWLSSIQRPLMQWGIMEHYRSISRGVVDSRDLLYYLSLITVHLVLADFSLKSRLQ